MRNEFFHRIHTVISEARKLLDDQTASIAPEVYAEMEHSGSLISAGTRINWNGVLKRAAVDLWDTQQNTPDNAPALWEDIAYRAGYRIIPDVITAGQAFAKGERGWWQDAVYESLVDANVYTPEAYPAGWTLIS